MAHTDTRDYAPLIQNVIIAAVRDAQSKDAVTALDALMFLTGDEAPLWLDAVGFERANPIEFVTSGRIRKLPKRKDINHE